MRPTRTITVHSYVGSTITTRSFEVGPDFGLTDDEWRARGCPVGLRYQEEVEWLFDQHQRKRQRESKA